MPRPSFYGETSCGIPISHAGAKHCRLIASRSLARRMLHFLTCTKMNPIMDVHERLRRRGRSYVP